MIFLESAYELCWYGCTLWFIFVYYECVTAIPYVYNFANQEGLSEWRYKHESINMFVATIASMLAFIFAGLELQRLFHHQWFV